MDIPHIQEVIMKFKFALWIAKLAAYLIRLIAPGRGTDFPGMLAYKIDKNFMLGFSDIDPEKVIFITGTNGKSTTTNLLYHTLTHAGKKVIANLSGSNMLNGAATVLITGSNMAGKIDADYILIEVDERSFPYIIRHLNGRNIVITNIMQDQVHRNGDPDFIYQLLRRNMPEGMRMFLNNDEPRSKSYEDLAKEVRYFGVARNSLSYNKEGDYEVTLPCPYCSAPIKFEYMNSTNEGEFYCTHCNFSSSATNTVIVENADFTNNTFEVGGVTHIMPYDTPIMLYNYAAVSCVCNWAGVENEKISAALSSFVNIEGRDEIITYKGKDIHILRNKNGNPETVQMCVDAIAKDPGEKLIVIGLCIIPERRPKFVPHYTNTYYAYETNFKPLRNSLGKILIFSDYIALDQVNRLYYDGFTEDEVDFVDSEDPKTVLDTIIKYDYEKIYFVAPLRNIKFFKSFIKKGE